jgi:hypothetical protein
MPYEQKADSFVLFVNADPKNDKSPNYTGRAKFHGEEYRLSAWVEVEGVNKVISVMMSADGLDTLRWKLRKNAKKSERGPTLVGMMSYMNSEVEVAAWSRESKGGLKFFSGSFGSKEQREAAAAAQARKDEEIPF